VILRVHSISRHTQYVTSCLLFHRCDMTHTRALFHMCMWAMTHIWNATRVWVYTTYTTYEIRRVYAVTYTHTRALFPYFICVPWLTYTTRSTHVTWPIYTTHSIRFASHASHDSFLFCLTHLSRFLYVTWFTHTSHDSFPLCDMIRTQHAHSARSSKNYRSLLQTRPIKETLFCKRDV